MLIKEAKDKVYQNLMVYAFQKCDVIKVTKYYDQHPKENDRVIKYILKDTGYSVDEVVEQFSYSFLDKMYEKYKDDPYIFDDKYKKRWETDAFGEKLRIMNRQSTVRASIRWLVYDINCARWLEKYKDNIIYKKHTTTGIFVPGTIDYTDIYYLKLTEELKQEILNKNSLYKDWWGFNSIEDICLFQNDICWLYTVSHEKLGDIYCKDEEEYNYLKSLGVEFQESKFEPIEKDDIIYADYLNQE